jgi:hypothetical protein
VYRSIFTSSTSKTALPPALLFYFSNVVFYLYEWHFSITAFYQESYSYNFMIGGDGNVYEGRGWNIQSDHQVLPNRKATEYGKHAYRDASFKETF